MPRKSSILDFLGDRALTLPALLDGALIANEQAKYVMSLLQLAASHADNPGLPAQSLKTDREACGIQDTSLDSCVRRSDGDGHGDFHIPGLGKLLQIFDAALQGMLAPIEAAGPLRDRLSRLLAARPDFTDDMITAAAIGALTSGDPAGGDSFHLLIMDLHREINRLQGDLATEEVAGAKACAVTDADRRLIEAFMAGLNRTKPLKFDHPGLDALAVRTGGSLLIQNDIGTTDAHVLVIRIDGDDALLTHTDVHLQRLRFFQDQLAPTGIVWEELHTEQQSSLAAGDLFYVARGRIAAGGAEELAGKLEHVGSRLVFLIDWNRARKRLDLLVPNDSAVSVLTWAAERGVGHYAFLSMGGERLIYDALEQAVKTPLRYGEQLHEMIGEEAARDYLCYALQSTAHGLLNRRSAAFILDQLRAELSNHFRSAEQRLLGDAERHARIIVQLAEALKRALHGGGKATQAKIWESRADEIVRQTRMTVRRIAGTEIFCRLLEVADDAADAIEDAAFLAGLLDQMETGWEAPSALPVMSDLALEAAHSYRLAIESAQQVHRGGPRETMQQFLEAIDTLVTVEHRADEQERAVVAALVEKDIDSRRLHLAGGVASHLEEATDSLLLAGILLRDHVMGDVLLA